MNTEFEAKKTHTEAAADEMMQAARKTAIEAGETARSAVESVTNAARGTIERTREAVAGSSEAVASKLRALADEDLSDTLPGRTMKAAASQLTDAADNLRKADFAGMVESGKAFARRNPELVVVGAALASFALFRLLRGTAPRGERISDKTRAEALS